MGHVMSSNEKFGGNHINNGHTKRLWSKIDNCKLIHISYKGCKYTWSNLRRRKNDLIMERLDKVSHASVFT